MSRLDLIGKQINIQLDIPEDFPIYFVNEIENILGQIYN